MMTRRTWLVSFFASALLCAGASCLLSAQSDTRPVEPAKRPAEWAQPVSLSGCPNLHKVTDNLYRGAQSSAEGMKELKKLGIKTVANLRSFHSDKDEIGDLGLRCENIEMKAWHAEDEDIVRFLKIATNKENGPVFVHCQHGADRTGIACAVYRIAVQGWTMDAAIDEMCKGGYGFHGVWENLRDYIEKLDVDAIKKRAGLADPAEVPKPGKE